MEDPLDVMKKGYKITSIVGIFGFPVICYNLLDHEGSWLYFTCCGWIGIIISYLFNEITNYFHIFIILGIIWISTSPLLNPLLMFLHLILGK